MIDRSTDIRAALKSRQRGFFTLPGGMGAGRPAGGGGGGSYFDAVMADSPSAYWRLNETAGTFAADSSGNGRSATYTANASTLTTAGLLTSDANKAILLPGTSSTVKNGFERDGTFISTASPWTFECLCRIDSVPVSSGVCTIWQAGDNTGGGNSLPELGAVNQGGGNYKFRVMQSGLAQLFLSTQLHAYGDKKHVVLRYSTGPEKVELFVNGIANGSILVTYAGNSGNAKCGFGIFGSGSDVYPMNGVLDEVAVYQSALSDARIAAHYAAV